MKQTFTINNHCYTIIKDELTLAMKQTSIILKCCPSCVAVNVAVTVISEPSGHQPRTVIFKLWW